jgi:hypothetical protein
VPGRPDAGSGSVVTWGNVAQLGGLAHPLPNWGKSEPALRGASGKVPLVNDHPCRALAPLCLLLLGACSAPSAGAPTATATPAPKPSLGKRSAAVADDCAEVPGQPPPEPLRIQYDGVAKAARCQREVYTIMGGVTHFLGVECKHCHQEPDYAADTHNKRVANWMAKELVPRLKQRDGEAVWCRDCHGGRAKFLGSPRRADFAVEWMLTHMVEDFQTNRGLPPKCKDCHGGDLGSADFRPKIILAPLAGPPLPAAEPGAAAPSASPSASALAPAPLAPATPSLPVVVPAPAPIPDFGGR